MNAVETSITIHGMQDFINSFDKLDENVQRAVETGMRAGAEIIKQEQKRLILARPNKDGSSSQLAGLLKVGKITSNRKGVYRIFIGYDKEAVKQHPEGVVIEFGRPSLYGKNVKYEIKQVRNGEEVEVVNGYIPEYSHIRRAWDNKIGEAAQAVIDSIDMELEAFGYGNVNSGEILRGTCE